MPLCISVLKPIVFMFTLLLMIVLSFGDVGEYACGPWGRWMVDISIFGAQLGFCCAYFGFIGENVHSVIFSYFDCLSVDKNLIMVLLSMYTNPPFLRFIRNGYACLEKMKS